MKEILEQMRVLLASNFAFYLKIHNFHWNVEGPNFPQYHDFLNNLYQEIWLAGDAIAEEIRSMDAYAPGSLSRFSTLSIVEDQINIPTAMNMFKELVVDNKKIIDLLIKIEKMASEEGCIGLSNFLQGRVDIHFKHGWMLKSITKV